MKKNEIIIDIKDIDGKTIREKEKFLQIDGYERVYKLLTNEIEKEIDNEKINDQRNHNTILINGKRGTGKTLFLLNIKNYLKFKDKKAIKKLYFFEPIDPTLLHDNESFLTIILAKILNNLEESGALTTLGENKKKKFYTLLNNISEAIDGVVLSHKENKLSALESISQDQTSLKLEKYLNKFFKLITSILKKRRLILLIDDIDMALNKGFEVLEVIRKYLSSPYIVPIVTGDLCLYQTIVCEHFSSKIKNDACKSDNEKCNTKTTDITIDYLVKVLPQNLRINLKNLLELSKDNQVVFKYDEDKFILNFNNTLQGLSVLLF